MVYDVPQNMKRTSQVIYKYLILTNGLLLLSCEQKKSPNEDVDAKKNPNLTDSKTDNSATHPKPEIVGFEGFINYGTPINIDLNENLLGTPEFIILTESRIEEPSFDISDQQIERMLKDIKQESKQPE